MRTKSQRAGSNLPLSFFLLGEVKQHYAAFFCIRFHFAQRARCAAAILFRPAADIVRLFPESALIARPPFGEPSVCKTAIALSSRPRSSRSSFSTTLISDIESPSVCNELCDET